MIESIKRQKKRYEENKNAWENTQMSITQWPHLQKAWALVEWAFLRYLWSILMGEPRSYCVLMKLCSQITFGTQNATKRLRKHTNDYHAMTSCHRALAVDAGSFSGYLWSILMGEPWSYCLFMKICNQITFFVIHMQQNSWEITEICHVHAKFLIRYGLMASSRPP